MTPPLIDPLNLALLVVGLALLVVGVALTTVIGLPLVAGAGVTVLGFVLALTAVTKA